MPLTIACKLPHGMVIAHGGQTIYINGANSYYDASNPAAILANGAMPDTATSAFGYGLTTINDDQAAAYEDWKLHALYKKPSEDAAPSKDAGMLDEPFTPLTNDVLLSFKNDTEARKELRGKAGVQSGFDGIDGDAEAKAAAAGSGLVDTGTVKD